MGRYTFTPTRHSTTHRLKQRHPDGHRMTVANEWDGRATRHKKKSKKEHKQTWAGIIKETSKSRQAQTSGWTDRRTDRWAHGQMHKQTHTGGQTKHAHRQIEKSTRPDKQTHPTLSSTTKNTYSYRGTRADIEEH